MEWPFINRPAKGLASILFSEAYSVLPPKSGRADIPLTRSPLRGTTLSPSDGQRAEVRGASDPPPRLVSGANARIRPFANRDTSGRGDNASALVSVRLTAASTPGNPFAVKRNWLIPLSDNEFGVVSQECGRPGRSNAAKSNGSNY